MAAWRYTSSVPAPKWTCRPLATDVHRCVRMCYACFCGVVCQHKVLDGTAQRRHINIGALELSEYLADSRMGIRRRHMPQLGGS